MVVRKCSCYLCKRHNRLDKIKLKLSKSEARFIEKLSEEMLLIEFELESFKKRPVIKLPKTWGKVKYEN